MMLNASAMNMNASTKGMWKRAADSTCDLGSFRLSLVTEPLILNTAPVCVRETLDWQINSGCIIQIISSLCRRKPEIVTLGGDVWGR